MLLLDLISKPICTFSCSVFFRFRFVAFLKLFCGRRHRFQWFFKFFECIFNFFFLFKSYFWTDPFPVRHSVFPFFAAFIAKKSGICIKPSVLYKKINIKNVKVHDCKHTDYWVCCLTTPLSINFRYIAGFSFIGGGNRSAQRKPRTCHKSLANFIT